MVDLRESLDSLMPQVVTETLVSIITRSFIQGEDGSAARVVAVKSGSTSSKIIKEPHDIVKEVRILASVSHPCIVELLGHRFDNTTSTLEFWMPYIPFTLAELLFLPSFSPRPHDTFARAVRDAGTMSFLPVARSLIFQILAGVAYLHHSSRRIAHRDLKPSNIVIDAYGSLKLIDFGIAYRELDTNGDREKDIWPELKTNMYFEVGSGPYRAPELLFGPRQYDPIASDLWSLGTVIAEFFTTIHRRYSDEDFDDLDEDEAEEPDPTMAYVLDKPPESWMQPEWERYTLFDGSRGDIGLAWSIFKTRGSPTKEIWPGSLLSRLPVPVNFIEASGVPLPSLLPNLPDIDSGTGVLSHFPPDSRIPRASDLIQRFLVYPQSRRIRALDAMEHPWISSGPPLLVPPCLIDLFPQAVAGVDGATLADHLRAFVPAGLENNC